MTGSVSGGIEKCPLCEAEVGSAAILSDRRAVRCTNCDLITVIEDDRLSPLEEHGRYLLHKNTRADLNYVTFLASLVSRLVEHVDPPAQVLDFGSGPEPVLAELLRENGYTVSIYDKFFADDPAVLNVQYDAVVCCETAEHFREPLKEWMRLISLTKEHGILAVKTLFHGEKTDIFNWWYMRDPTHVCFYSHQTMRWIAQHFGCNLECLDARHAVLKAKAGP
ncbi:MAG: class I SAM-dependent methyltransferase [Calditrichaeota bacterium]|nr:class I SAM-dependent methyltransferase [Calditrichota bacterium]MCB9391086.1 class I SAM-dependent methyltransferase [Calditrichota bacterium]